MSVWRAIFFSSIERYYGIVVAFVTTIIISRLLTPAEVGAFSVAMSLAGIASILREFGASNFLIRAPNITTHQKSCAFGITLLLGSSLGLLLLLAANPLAVFFAQDDIATLLYILSINFFLLPFGIVNFALIQREMRFDLSARIGVIATTLSAAVSIGLAWKGFGAFSLAWGSIVLSAVSATLTIGWGPGPAFVCPRLRGASDLLSFGANTTGLTLLWEVSARFPEFIIGKLSGLTAAGLLTRASGLAANANDFLVKGLQPVTLPYFSRVEREGADLAQTHYRIATLMTGIGWPTFAVLAVAAEPLTLAMYGQQWLGIVTPFQILCVQMAYGLLFSYQLQVVMVKNQMPVQVRASLLAFPFRLALVAIGAAMGVNETCWAILASQILGSAIAARWVYPKIGVSIKNYFEIAKSSTFPAVATLAGAIAGTMLAAAVDAGNLLKLGLIGGMGFMAALLVLYFSTHPIKNEVEAFIRSRR